MSSYILLDNDPGLATLTLAHEAERNALSFELLSELNTVLDSIATVNAIQIVLLRASGPVFSAGMNLKTVALEDPEQAERFARLLAKTYRRLLLLPIPLLCGVDGPAMGGAVGLALAADLVWAGPKARFAFPETRIGIVPALVSVVARRRLAPGKLQSLALSGSEVGAEDALRLGLVDFVSTDSGAFDAFEFARKMLRENSSEAMRRTKSFLQAALLKPTLDKDIEAAVVEFRIAAKTDACRRGLQAFREKKPLDWDA